MKKRTICLVLIVKNERHIIEEGFNSILKYFSPGIDYWVISDTGSTDGTQQFIKDYFKEKNIPGELFEDKWISFDHNRSLAFRHAERAKKKCDYMWVFDADDLLTDYIPLPEVLDKDVYFLQFGSEACYFRQQIFKRSLGWKYRGVLHEFPVCVSKPDNKLTGMMIPSKDPKKEYLLSRRLGDRSKNPNKYFDDAKLLEKEIERIMSVGASDKDYDLRHRYEYFVAQSYFDCKHFEEATKYYLKAGSNKHVSEDER